MSIKVIVADDSALMRKVISDILESDPNIRVIGKAKNGKEAIEMAKFSSPDVLTLDLNLPDMTGLEVIKKVMKDSPLPIVIISALSQQGSKYTLDALEAGAVDFVPKPSGEISVDITNVKDIILSKVRAASLARIHKVDIKPKSAIIRAFSPTRKKIIIIGASTGGPQTIEAILTQIPRNFPAPILIVQHMPPGNMTKMFAQRLSSLCDIEVREAKDGDELKTGVALIAPGGYHMILRADVEGEEGCIRLTDELPEQGVKPCVNKLFRSVAKIFRENTIAVVLTGMGADGKDGCREIKEYNGTVIAEAEESCIVFGMPHEVIKENLADEILPLEKIAVAILQLTEI